MIIRLTLIVALMLMLSSCQHDSVSTDALWCTRHNLRACVEGGCAHMNPATQMLFKYLYDMPWHVWRRFNASLILGVDAIMMHHGQISAFPIETQLEIAQWVPPHTVRARLRSILNQLQQSDCLPIPEGVYGLWVQAVKYLCDEMHEGSQSIEVCRMAYLLKLLLIKPHTPERIQVLRQQLRSWCVLLPLDVQDVAVLQNMGFGGPVEFGDIVVDLGERYVHKERTLDWGVLCAEKPARYHMFVPCCFARVLNGPCAQTVFDLWYQYACYDYAKYHKGSRGLYTSGAASQSKYIFWKGMNGIGIGYVVQVDSDRFDFALDAIISPLGSAHPTPFGVGVYRKDFGMVTPEGYVMGTGHYLTSRRVEILTLKDGAQNPVVIHRPDTTVYPEQEQCFIVDPKVLRGNEVRRRFGQERFVWPQPRAGVS